MAERDPLDRYYTPADVAEAVVGALGVLPGQTAWEPSCGGGAFVRALRARGVVVDGVDLDPDAPGLREVRNAHVGDFVRLAPQLPRASWVVMNPPFAHVDRHLAAAFAVGSQVALVARATWLGSAERTGDLEAMRPDRVLLPTPRPSFAEGRGTDAAPVVVVVWHRVGTPAPFTRFELLPWRRVQSHRLDRGLALAEARKVWGGRA